MLKQHCGYCNTQEFKMSFDSSQLSMFTGSDNYYRLCRRHLLTDGTKYVAETASAFWMMDAVASHLSEIGTNDSFVLVRVSVTDAAAVMRYEDGNGNLHAEQAILYTDFPMQEFTLYACWDGEHWVLMLPSEY
jgi:hypothetical protein